MILLEFLLKRLGLQKPFEYLRIAARARSPCLRRACSWALVIHVCAVFERWVQDMGDPGSFPNGGFGLQKGVVLERKSARTE